MTDAVPELQLPVFDTVNWRGWLYCEQLKDQAEFIASGTIDNLLHARCQRVEKVCKAAFSSVFRDSLGVALVATGGFGRGEMFPYSDVDLLFLLGDTEDDQLLASIEKLLRLLWDSGLQPSHATRSIVQCVKVAISDLSSATALFEARILAGDNQLVKDMLAAIGVESMWNGRDYLHAKQEELRLRHLRFNDTAFNLEPNIKEGPGGLRDIHTLIWIAGRAFGAARMEDWAACGLCSNTDLHNLTQSRALLGSIRYGLHRLAQRREECLLFEHQRNLAQVYEPASGLTENVVVENFMQKFSRAAAKIRRIADRLLSSWRDRLDGHTQRPITRVAKNYFERSQRLNTDLELLTPVQVLTAFETLLDHPDLNGLAPDLEAKISALCQQQAENWDAPEIARSLLRIFRHSNLVMKVVTAMADCGVFGRIVPAFERITGRMQYDMFHVYTVDQHTLFVMDKLHSFSDANKLAAHPFAYEIYSRLRKPELLLLAGLFHDIAKGCGGDHSELGEVEAKKFCVWLGLSEPDIDLVAWLVHQHLIMSTTAQKKDIGDPSVVHHFATVVAERERLDYLYLLTVADIYATSPKLWNSWKSQLLASLYESTRFVLRRGLEHPVHAAERIFETQTIALSKLNQSGYDLNAVRNLWDEFPEENFLSFLPGQLIWQTAALLDHGKRKDPLVAARSIGDRGGTEIFVYSPDRDGLFATITAVLDRFQLGVQEARIMTSVQAHVLDFFQVLDAKHQFVNEERLLEFTDRLRAELTKSELLLTPARRAWTRQQKHFHVPLQLEFSDNDPSRYTEFALICSDRPGLLAHVAQAFRACGVRVHDARIATFGQRVEDFFELTDEKNQPLDDAQLHALRATLNHELETQSRQSFSLASSIQ